MYSRSEPVLLPLFPRFVYLTLSASGYTEQALFDGLDFGPDQLHDEKYRLSIEQHEGFILRALELTGDPHYALHLSRHYDATQSNLALLAVANSGEIARALHLLTRYSKLFTRVFTIRVLNEGSAFQLDVEPHLEHEQVIYFAIGSLVVLLNKFFDEALRGARLVERVEMSVPAPPGFDAVAEHYGAPITFDHARTRIHIDANLLDKPMRQADPQTVRLLMQMCERQLEEANAEASFTGMVNALLAENIAAPPKLDAAARHLGVSPRGLRRKLAEAGTTYQKQLDTLRAKIATRLLRDTNEPVSSIAYELGFDNASDFGRAFKKWTGQTPSAARDTSR